MDKIEYDAGIIADMYKTLFSAFFGTDDDTTINTSNEVSRFRKTHSDKCPARMLTVNALAELQNTSPQELPEVKKTVRSYLTRTKLIDFEKLDSMYTIIRDQQFDANQTEQYKESILAVLNPQYLMAVYLYMKYHKVYIRELFEDFYSMVMTDNQCPDDDIQSFCLAVLSNGEELVAAVREEIYGTNAAGEYIPEGLYRKVYADFLENLEIYPSFSAYQPSMDKFKSIVETVLKKVEDEKMWKPKKLQKAKSGKIYKSGIKRYLNTLTKLTRKAVIIKLDTKSGQDTSLNLRTIRSNSSELTFRFKLAVPFEVKQEYSNTLTSCPDFLLHELWSCLEQKGLRGKSDDKLKTDSDSLIDSEQILLIGRLYMIILLCYAFDSNNYKQYYSFKEIIVHSLESSHVKELLMVYQVLVNDENDKKIINELFSRS